MIKLERPDEDRLVMVAAPTPKWATGLAYLFLAGLFLYLGVTEGRWTSTALGLLNVVFAYFTIAPRSKTTATFDRTKGTLTLNKQTMFAKGEITHNLSEIKEIEVRSIKALWRTVYYLNFQLESGQQMAIQHSLDNDQQDKMKAAEALQDFLKK